MGWRMVDAERGRRGQHLDNICVFFLPRSAGDSLPSAIAIARNDSLEAAAAAARGLSSSSGATGAGGAVAARRALLLSSSAAKQARLKQLIADIERACAERGDVSSGGMQPSRGNNAGLTCFVDTAAQVATHFVDALSAPHGPHGACLPDCLVCDFVKLVGALRWAEGSHAADKIGSISYDAYFASVASRVRARIPAAAPQSSLAVEIDDVIHIFDDVERPGREECAQETLQLMTQTLTHGSASPFSFLVHTSHVCPHGTPVSTSATASISSLRQDWLALRIPPTAVAARSPVLQLSSLLDHFLREESFSAESPVACSASCPRTNVRADAPYGTAKPSLFLTDGGTQYLLVHLQRCWQDETTRLHAKYFGGVQLPDVLDLSDRARLASPAAPTEVVGAAAPHMRLSQQSAEGVFDLLAFSVHTGGSIHNGHYFTWHWRSVDDEFAFKSEGALPPIRVKRSSEQLAAAKQQWYLAVYKRRNA